MHAVCGGALLPGDLCDVLSLPEVACCVIIEQRASQWSRWFTATLGGLTCTRQPLYHDDASDTALCITPDNVEERDGICSHRWRPGTRGQARFFQRIGGRPTTARKGPSPTGGQPRYLHTSSNYRRKIFFCRALPRGADPAATPAHRWWCAAGTASRSFTAIRQKMFG